MWVLKSFKIEVLRKWDSGILKPSQCVVMSHCFIFGVLLHPPYPLDPRLLFERITKDMDTPLSLSNSMSKYTTNYVDDSAI